MAANARSSASPQRETPVSVHAGDAYGYEPLRQAIAAYVAKSRAIRCTSEQVLVVSGSQQALDLCARVLINQGDSVDIENPGYPGSHGVFRAHGARVHTVPVDQDGIVCTAAEGGNACYLRHAFTPVSDWRVDVARPPHATDRLGAAT